VTESKRDRQVYEVLIAAPIEDVWSELVNTASPRPFFFDARCETPGMEIGSPYRMVSRDGKSAVVVGEILELEPPRRYVQSFRFTQYDDQPCKVIYTLDETDAGVLFRLITENVPAGTKTEKSMAQGGHFITANLKAYMETGRPTFGGRLVLTMIRLMAPFAPAASNIENWPLSPASGSR